jgi:hypothetical protein
MGNVDWHVSIDAERALTVSFSKKIPYFFKTIVIVHAD